MTWETPDGPRIVAGCEARLLKHALAAMVDTYEMDTQAGCDPAEYGITLFDELAWDERLGVLDHVGKALFSPHAVPPTPSAVMDSAVAALFNQILHEIEFELEQTEGKEEHQRRFWRTLVADAFREAFHEEDPSPVEETDDAKTHSEEQLVTKPEPLPSWLFDGPSGDSLSNDDVCNEDFAYEFSDESIEDEELSFTSSLPDLEAYGELTGEEDDDVWCEDDDVDDFDEVSSESIEGWVSIYDSPPIPDCRDLEVWYDVIDALTDRVLSDRDFDLADRFLDAPPGLANELRETLGIARDYFVTPAPDALDPPSHLAARLRLLAKPTN